MYYKESKCIDCGKDFIKRNRNQVRCKECQKIFRNKYKPKEKPKSNDCTCKKKDCIYHGANGDPVTCHYMLIKNESRKCAVDNCNKYKKGRKIKEKIVPYALID